ncbi:FAD-dependent oxidoreductase [Mycoplasmatota bacterium]|nr:FAD-dependent oxidoreductase [Mycoplasmatota bacterium]
MKKSLWDDVDYNELDPLKENVETDVLIIGGGIAGISTAYHLIDSGKRVTLIDRDVCGRGVSLYTTGKLTFLQKLIYHKLEFYHGFEKARDYLFATKKIINEVSEIINENDIDCDYEEVPSYVVSNKNEDVLSFNDEIEFLKKCNIDAELFLETPYGENKFTLKVNEGAVFHPFKYINSLKGICLDKGINIYEKTVAKKMRRVSNKVIIETDRANVTAENVIMACHFPFVNFPGFYFMRMHLERSYVDVSKRNGNFSLITADSPITSIRFHKDNLIFGGSGHILSKKYSYLKRFNSLKEKREEIFPGTSVMAWSTHDCITQDGLPYIGRFDGYSNVYVATGFNKWGMTNGSIAGKIISDLITKNESEFQHVFNPRRKIRIKNFLKDMGNSISNYFTHSKKKELIKINEGGITKEHLGVFKDAEGEHFVRTKCPHLGCELFFNDTDKTWDCSCHGSRFNIHGQVIQGPSTRDISL